MCPSSHQQAERTHWYSSRNTLFHFLLIHLPSMMMMMMMMMVIEREKEINGLDDRHTQVSTREHRMIDEPSQTFADRSGLCWWRLAIVIIRIQKHPVYFFSMSTDLSEMTLNISKWRWRRKKRWKRNTRDSIRTNQVKQRYLLNTCVDSLSRQRIECHRLSRQWEETIRSETYVVILFASEIWCKREKKIVLSIPFFYIIIYCIITLNGDCQSKGRASERKKGEGERERVVRIPHPVPSWDNQMSNTVRTRER